MESLPKGRALILLVLTFFFWGSLYIGSKMIADSIPAPLVASLRCVVAIFPLLLMARKYSDVKIDRADWKFFFLIGSVGYFLTFFLVQLGISLTGASIAALVNSLAPVSVSLMAALILKEKITPIKYLCLFLALAGTVIVTSGAGKDGEMTGVLIVLLSVLCWGVSSVYMRQLTRKYPAILVTAYGMAISLLFHIPVGIVTALSQPVKFSVESIGVLLYLGVIGSGLSHYTWTQSLAILPASTCSLFYPLQPIFSAILGVLILGESLHISFFWGLLLISIDVVLSTWETARQARPSKSS